MSVDLFVRRMSNITLHEFICLQQAQKNVKGYINLVFPLKLDQSDARIESKNQRDGKCLLAWSSQSVSWNAKRIESGNDSCVDAE